MFKRFGLLPVMVAVVVLLVGGMSVLAGHGGPLDDSGPSILAQGGADEDREDVDNDADVEDADTGGSEDADTGGSEDADTGESEDVDDGEVEAEETR